MAKKTDAGLIDLPKKGTGPVYQGVCKQIRALVAAETIDRHEHAGMIAQARSLAASIDRVSGHDGGFQASGMQLAALHEQLGKALERLTPAGAERDEFQELLSKMDQAIAEGAGIPDGHPEAPHPA